MTMQSCPVKQHALCRVLYNTQAATIWFHHCLSFLPLLERETSAIMTKQKKLLLMMFSE